MQALIQFQRYGSLWGLLAGATACTPLTPPLEARIAGSDGVCWDIIAETGPLEEPKFVEGFYLLPTHHFYHYNYFDGYPKRTLFNVETVPTTAAGRTSPQGWSLRDSVLTLNSTVQYQVHFRSPDTLCLAAVDTAHVNSLVLVRSRRDN